MTHLPIDNILAELKSFLKANANVIVTAEPGAGKTTRVPLALLDEPWLTGKKIIMLEPRRIAAVRSADYMAELLQEKTGGTVGYRIRGDQSVGKSTRLEVVTEGILTRMLQEDASLPGVGLIIFDEFHERSIHADLGLALALNVQEHLRNDLKILVMSATLDGVAIGSLLGNAAILKSSGRTFPVTTIYLKNEPDGFIEPLTANTIVKALRENEGDILVFLPGQREIKRVESLLTGKELPSNVSIHLLYGEAPPERQRAALNPDLSGKRKVILSTNIAETSLTINGVTVVIDSGLARVSSFDPRRGMSGLITIPISHSSAEQRKGRAGRELPGVCYRLWTENRHTQLQKYSRPEILSADLAPLAMELSQWGDAEAKDLKFLDPPPASNLKQARALLHQLGALQHNGALSAHGKMMAQLPIHPRYAHMLLKAKGMHAGKIACTLAAILEEREIRGKSGLEIDLAARYEMYASGSIRDQFVVKRIREQASRLELMVGLDSKNVRSTSERSDARKLLGPLLALAYPERVAKRKSGDKYQLSGNTIALLPKSSPLSNEEYLAVGEVDGAGNDIKIFLAEPITEADIRRLFAEQLQTLEEIYWDEKVEGVKGRTVTTLGAIELSVKSFVPPPEQTLALVTEYVRSSGLKVLPWNKECESFRRRSEWLRKNSLVNDWINLSDDHLTATLDHWLAPFLNGISRKSQLDRLETTAILRSLFTMQQQREVERLAPTHLTVPTGSHIPIDYSADQPVLAVRLQEMFGETKTPTVGGGKVKVQLHLLSPARRPIAITQDLPSFWKNGYLEARKVMRGEYPKHYWPENPLEAAPTKKTKKHM